MRLLIWAMTVCLFLISAFTGIVESADPEEAQLYERIEVSPSVVMALHDNGSNISCVALDEGLVFFDAGLSTRTAVAFRREMEEAFQRPTMALVLTHAHLDHILGMAAFADVSVYAAQAGRPRWEHLVAIEWDERAIAGYAAVFPTLPDEIPDAELRLPTDWFSDELVLGSGENEIRIRRTGGHTVDSSSAVIAAAGVVIAGDLVQARRRPYFGEPDTDFPAWIATLSNWEAIEVGSVCPGHGPVIYGAELGEIRLWFEAASATAKKLKAEGATMEELAAHDDLASGYWPDDGAPPRWWGYCIKRLYDAS